MSSDEPKFSGKECRSECPVACALDVIGDRWTLLVVRDIFKGKNRYNEFLGSSENFPTNILANRLKRLEDESIIEKKLYNQHPPRWEYHLTKKGLELGKVVEAMYHWGNKHILEKIL
ncbi:MAG: helix-turn-helix domain-containing protein [Acidobacteriota bacterium]